MTEPMQIGDILVAPVYDGVMTAEATAAYKGTTAEQWAPHRRFLRDDGLVEFAIGGFLIRAPQGRTVLVDTGMGAHTGTGMGGVSQFSGGALLESLAALDTHPEDITDVVFTHLHWDHVGWSSREGAIVFPNAVYRCDTRDWEHFRGNERVQPLLAPITERLTVWDGSGPIVAGIDAMSAPGHTPGSTIIVLSSGAARGLLLGDVVHCPVELLDDEWAGLGDVDPGLAKQTRNRLAREIEGTDTPVAAAHFPGMVFGRLLAANGRRSWVV
jgi:glyoxylase-like metal-dependent hydrolase (beta-lactamase superfamily II)